MHFAFNSVLNVQLPYFRSSSQLFTFPCRRRRGNNQHWIKPGLSGGLTSARRINYAGLVFFGLVYLLFNVWFWNEALTAYFTVIEGSQGVVCWEQQGDWANGILLFRLKRSAIFSSNGVLFLCHFQTSTKIWLSFTNLILFCTNLYVDIVHDS